jgi:hypothetical protein
MAQMRWPAWVRKVDSHLNVLLRKQPAQEAPEEIVNRNQQGDEDTEDWSARKGPL